MLNLLMFTAQLSDSTMNPAAAAENTAGSDIFVVMMVTLIVWLGIFFYLVTVNNKLNHLKKQVEAKSATEA